MEAFQSALNLLRLYDAGCFYIMRSRASALPFAKHFDGIGSAGSLPLHVYDHGVMISDNDNADTDETLSFLHRNCSFNSALLTSSGTALDERNH
jgi:hypothetical protein